MNNINELQERILKLEAQMKRKNAWLTLLVLVFLSLPLLGLNEPENRVAVAEAFVLQNREGKVCAELSLSQNQFPRLILYDNQENPRATFLLTEKGIPGMAFMDSQGRSGIGLGLDPTGKPAIALLDQQGSKRINLSVSDNGEAAISLLDAKQKGKVALSVSPQGASRLQFFDTRGSVRASLKVEEDGLPGLIFSEGEDLRMAFGILRNRDASMVLTDKDGRVVFQVPEKPKEK